MRTDAPAGERRLDPEAALQHARDVAWRSLNQRDRTEAELRGKLADKRVESALIEQVLGELQEGGYVDDASYARRFAEDRRRLDAWGSDRIARRLRALGVAPEHVEAAVAGQDGEEELGAALVLLERRFPRVDGDEWPASPRERDRAFGVLVRKGYEPELAYDALRRYAGAAAELD